MIFILIQVLLLYLTVHPLMRGLMIGVVQVIESIRLLLLLMKAQMISI